MTYSAVTDYRTEVLANGDVAIFLGVRKNANSAYVYLGTMDKTAFEAGKQKFQKAKTEAGAEFPYVELKH